MSVPRVVRTSGVASAEGARGAVVVIDVLRAFTTAAYAVAAGASEVVLVATVEQAFALRERRFPGALLVGEVGGRPIAGFDHGNSPEAVAALDLAGRRVILRSSSGTQGVVRATSASSLWLGSLVTASATARALAGQELATLVACGAPQGPDGDEDEACAELLEARLLGRPCDERAIVRRVELSPAGQLAYDPGADWITPGDLARATAVDRFGFALRARREDGLDVARPVAAGVAPGG